MQIEINKEIRSFTEAIILGLSLRQCIFTTIAGIISLGIYIFFNKSMTSEMLSWIIVGVSIPCGLMGFFTYNKMYFEKFIVVYVKTVFLTPSRLVFKAMPFEIREDEDYRKGKKFVKNRKKNIKGNDKNENS